MKQVTGHNIKITVVEPLVVMELLVSTGDRSLSNDRLAIFKVRNLANFVAKYPDVPLVCEAYNDAAILAYETRATLVDVKGELVACPARCHENPTTPSKLIKTNR